MKNRNTLVLVHFIFIVSISQEEINVCSTAFINQLINLPKSGLLHLTRQPYCKKSRSAKVKDGIINIFLRNYLLDRYRAGFKSRCPIDSKTDHHFLIGTKNFKAFL